MKTLAFKSPALFKLWLEKNHDKAEGVWLRIFKIGSAKTSVTYAEALDEALCFGWIDGQKRSYDEISWLQKFIPRQAKSRWSKVNTEHVERLIKARLMKPPGLRVVEAAKADGRWQAAYEPQSKAALPEDFLKALAENPKAREFVQTLSRANIYAIVYRLQTAKKSDTRERRMKMILAMLNRGEAFR